MSFYHVIVQTRSSLEFRVLFEDLSRRQLQLKFLRPYRRGKDILCGGEIVHLNEIASVKIIFTEQASELERQCLYERSRTAIDRFNRESEGVFFLGTGHGYAPEDIEEAGADVTTRFINDVPGHSKFSVSAFILEHAFSIFGTVIGGLILAGITSWLGGF